jgi:hypothetical protein
MPLWMFSLALCFLSLASTVFFLSKVAEENALLRDLIDRALAYRILPERLDTVLALSETIFATTNRVLPRDSLGWYDRWESTTFFNVTSAVSLKHGEFGIIDHSQVGPCGTMSRVLLNALWKLEIPARKLQLMSGTKHTVVEYLDRGRWAVVSPSDSSYVWRKDNGAPATAGEIASDTTLFHRIYSVHPNFAYTFASLSHIRWEKVPLAIHQAMVLLLGAATCETMETPHLYDEPRTLFFLASLVLTALSGLTTLTLWRMRRSGARAGSQSRGPRLSDDDVLAEIQQSDGGYQD